MNCYHNRYFFCFLNFLIIKNKNYLNIQFYIEFIIYFKVAKSIGFGITSAIPHSLHFFLSFSVNRALFPIILQSWNYPDWSILVISLVA